MGHPFSAGRSLTTSRPGEGRAAPPGAAQTGYAIPAGPRKGSSGGARPHERGAGPLT